MDSLNILMLFGFSALVIMSIILFTPKEFLIIHFNFIFKRQDIELIFLKRNIEIKYKELYKNKEKFKKKLITLLLIISFLILLEINYYFFVSITNSTAMHKLLSHAIAGLFFVSIGVSIIKLSLVLNVFSYNKRMHKINQYIKQISDNYTNSFNKKLTKNKAG